MFDTVVMRPALVLRSVLAGVLLLLCVTVPAQSLSVRTAFAQMPDSLLPYLSEGNRLDMMDFIDSGMKARVLDQFGDTVCMDILTDSYVHVILSPVSTLELKVLSDSVFCMVMTYGGKIKESRVTFYDSSWTPVDVVIKGYDLSVPYTWVELSPDDASVTVHSYDYDITEKEGIKPKVTSRELPL